MFLALLDHPWIFAFLVLCVLAFIRMTYDFILRLFGKKGFENKTDEHWVGTINDAPPPPPEPAKVPNPPTPPDDVLEAEEDLPCKDFKDEDDYVYRDGNLGISSWTTDFKPVEEVKKEKEGVH
jgi:hypothetical protein